MSKCLLLFSTVCLSAFAGFEVYLKEPNQIPLYAQETNVWCGAASAQMMLEGFPYGIDHVFKQKYIWDTIQPLKVETSWYTDPDGLKKVMNALGTGTHWEAKCVQNSAALMKSVIRNLNDRKYPITVLVYGSAHWIVLIGATTDVEPTSAPSIVLEKVEAHDPWKAQHVLVSGTTWFQKYWYGPARSRGKWSGCFVAVQENTNTFRGESPWELRVKAPTTDGSPISSQSCLELARTQLAQLASENKGFANLVTQEMFEPRLVNDERGSYYLISIGESRSRLANGAIMLNAYTGEWEGLSQFHKPIRYFDVRSRAGEWYFTPSQESRSPFFPVYRMQIGNETTYLDFEGNLSSELRPMVNGS